jgi:hypothetical protein
MKRVYRLDAEVGLAVRRRRRKRLLRDPLASARLLRANQEWAMDFIVDGLASDSPAVARDHGGLIGEVDSLSLASRTAFQELLRVCNSLCLFFYCGLKPETRIIPMLPAQLPRLHSGLLLLQHPDDLLFAESALLHAPSSRSIYERTPALTGRVFRRQVCPRDRPSIHREHTQWRSAVFELFTAPNFWNLA